MHYKYKVSAYDLRCEYTNTPLGISRRNPRFSWKIQSVEHNIIQTAYHIIVGKSRNLKVTDDSLVWNSGVVYSNRQYDIEYEGKPLEALTGYFWRVKLICGEDTEALRLLEDKLNASGVSIEGVIEYHQGSEENAICLVRKVREKIGKLDIFVDNGSNGLLKGWTHTYEEIYEDLRRTQLGLMLTVKHIGALMAEQDYGSIIFISNYAALVGCDVHKYEDNLEKFDEDFSLTYGFVKGSYVNYTRQAAGYLGEHNVRCNCIAFAPMYDEESEGFSKAFIRHSHLKRMTSAEDIKAAVVFLASDASSYITGVTLPVDGGYTAK